MVGATIGRVRDVSTVKKQDIMLSNALKIEIVVLNRGNPEGMGINGDIGMRGSTVILEIIGIIGITGMIMIGGKGITIEINTGMKEIVGMNGPIMM